METKKTSTHDTLLPDIWNPGPFDAVFFMTRFESLYLYYYEMLGYAIAVETSAINRLCRTEDVLYVVACHPAFLMVSSTAPCCFCLDST